MNHFFLKSQTTVQKAHTLLLGRKCIILQGPKCKRSLYQKCNQLIHPWPEMSTIQTANTFYFTTVYNVVKSENWKLAWGSRCCFTSLTDWSCGGGKVMSRVQPSVFSKFPRCAYCCHGAALQVQQPSERLVCLQPSYQSCISNSQILLLILPVEHHSHTMPCGLSISSDISSY